MTFFTVFYINCNKANPICIKEIKFRYCVCVCVCVYLEREREKVKFLRVYQNNIMNSKESRCNMTHTYLKYCKLIVVNRELVPL